MTEKYRLRLVVADRTPTWEATRDKEAGGWVASWHTLTVSADLYLDLIEVIGEAMTLFFQDLVDEGDLAEFLEQRGWRSWDALPPKGTPVEVVLPVGLRDRSGELEAMPTLPAPNDPKLMCWHDLLLHRTAWERDHMREWVAIPRPGIACFGKTEEEARKKAKKILDGRYKDTDPLVHYLGPVED